MSDSYPHESRSNEKLDVTVRDEGAVLVAGRILDMVKELRVEVGKANARDAVIELDFGRVHVVLDVHVTMASVSNGDGDG